MPELEKHDDLDGLPEPELFLDIDGDGLYRRYRPNPRAEIVAIFDAERLNGTDDDEALDDEALDTVDQAGTVPQASYFSAQVDELARLGTFPEGRRRVQEILEQRDDDSGRKFKEYVFAPVQEAVERIFASDKYVHFLGNALWQELKVALKKDPDDPDRVSGLAETLFLEGGVADAQNLLFETRSGEELLRWPDHLETCLLAAKIYDRAGNIKGIGMVLLDDGGIPKFPESVLAGTLLLKYTLEYGGRNPDELRMDRLAGSALLYSGPQVLHSYVAALLDRGKEEEIRECFSRHRKRFQMEVSYPLIKNVLGLLHARKKHDLLLYVCEESAAAKPDLLTVPGFLGYYSRALNARGRFEESIRLLTKETSQGLVPKFPRDVHCMKNLAYALIALRRTGEAEVLIASAVASGLSRTEFAHLDNSMRGRRKRGGPPERPRV